MPPSIPQKAILHVAKGKLGFDDDTDGGSGTP